MIIQLVASVAGYFRAGGIASPACLIRCATRNVCRMGIKKSNVFLSKPCEFSGLSFYTQLTANFLLSIFPMFPHVKLALFCEFRKGIQSERQDRSSVKSNCQVTIHVIGQVIREDHRTGLSEGH